MKKIPPSRNVVTLFCMMFLAITAHTTEAASDYHSFDSLFPKTWYTKATESCAQVWGAFEELIAYPSASPTNRSIIVDAALGRLVFARFCLDLLVQEQDQTVSYDDISYLTHIVEQVDARYVRCADALERDRAYCVKRVLDDLKQKLFSLKP